MSRIHTDRSRQSQLAKVDTENKDVNAKDFINALTLEDVSFITVCS